MNKNNFDQNLVNTFSIVGFDPNTGELGIAVASRFLSVGAVVPFAKAGVGAIATQSFANTQYGPKGLKYMEEGLDAEAAMKRVLEEDEDPTFRQVGFVDAQGRSATFTGEKCYDWAGGITGPNFACQGNILTDENVVKHMADVFQKTEGDLATRLLKALLAGEEAGGDSRGKQSAALLVVKEKGGYGGFNDRYIDLRVDDHEEPVLELMRIHKLHQLYFLKSDSSQIAKVEGELRDEIVAALAKLELLGGQDVTEEQLTEALHTFHSIENFESRLQEDGKIDLKVAEYLEILAKQKESREALN